jgi:benzodiazapine receptor
MNKYLCFILFLVLNFGALFVGTYLMNSGPTSEWYILLKKAPWTPPGWVFGFAWSTIMIFFSIFMSLLITRGNTLKFWLLFALQWCLNVSWNWMFFNRHQILFSQIILVGLTCLVGYYLYRSKSYYYSVFIVPYFLWLLVANSLNLYVVSFN